MSGWASRSQPRFLFQRNWANGKPPAPAAGAGPGVEEKPGLDPVLSGGSWGPVLGLESCHHPERVGPGKSPWGGGGPGTLQEAGGTIIMAVVVIHEKWRWARLARAGQE